MDSILVANFIEDYVLENNFEPSSKDNLNTVVEKEGNFGLA